MKGILLLSHGDMAKGMLQSSSIFFGENLPQVHHANVSRAMACFEHSNFFKVTAPEARPGHAGVAALAARI